MNNDESTTEEIIKSMLPQTQPMIFGGENTTSNDMEDPNGARSMVALITGKDIIGYLRKGMKEE